MQCVVAYGAADPWAMQVGLKRQHVVWGLCRRTGLARDQSIALRRQTRNDSVATTEVVKPSVASTRA